MTANLTLNSSKTELWLIGLKNQLAKIQNASLNSHSARNLGFIFNKHLTFFDEITLLSKAWYSFIRQLRCIRPYFDSSTACTIATSIVHSKLITIILCTMTSLSLNYLVSRRSRTPLLVLSLKLLSTVISLPSYALSTGPRSLNASNIQAPLTYLQIWPPLNV